MKGLTIEAEDEGEQKVDRLDHGQTGFILVSPHVGVDPRCPKLVCLEFVVERSSQERGG